MMSKQYLLMVEEDVMQSLKHYIKGLQFIEVQGFSPNNETKFNFVVTPVTPILNQEDAPPPPDMVKDEESNA